MFKLVAGGASLGAGEYRAGARVLDADGREVIASTSSTVVTPDTLSADSRLGGMQPTGTLSTTIVDRTDIGGTFTPTSGILRLSAGSDLGTYIPAGTVITNINVMANGASVGAALTNSWLCLIRVSTLVAQATTVDRLTATLVNGAPTVYRIASTLGGAVNGSWTCPTSAVYYFGLCVAGTTMPVLLGNTNSTAATIAPALTGNSSTALTTPATLPGTVATPSGGGPAFWAWAT